MKWKVHSFLCDIRNNNENFCYALSYEYRMNELWMLNICSLQARGLAVWMVLNVCPLHLQLQLFWIPADRLENKSTLRWEKLFTNFLTIPKFWFRFAAMQIQRFVWYAAETHSNFIDFSNYAKIMRRRVANEWNFIGRKFSGRRYQCQLRAVHSWLGRNCMCGV